MRCLTTIVMIFLTALGQIMGQGKEYEGPEDPAGDIAAEREGYMTGNRVFIYFRNTTELSDLSLIHISEPTRPY